MKPNLLLPAGPSSIGTCLSQLLYPNEPRYVIQKHFCLLKLTDNGYSCLYCAGWMRMKLLDSRTAVFQSWFDKKLLGFIMLVLH